MKKRLTISICLLIFWILNDTELSAQLSISDPISVTQGDDTFGKKSPKLALNANGDLMVFWMRTGNEAFYLSTLEAGTFSAPIQIPFGGLNPNLWSGSLGPNMAAGGGHMYVTFEVYGDAIYVTHSADAGQTWDAPVAAFVPPQGRRATIPTIAVDPQGHPYIAYVNTNTSETDAYYGMVRSTDFGSSFLSEVDVSENAAGAEVCECCNGHIAVAANGDVYVAFRNNDANLRDIWLARSTDGGATFGSAFDVDETDWTAGVCPSNGPHFTIVDDQVVTAFFSGAGASGSGVYYSTFDTNTSLAGPTIDLPLTNEDFGNQNRPRIAGSGDILAIVWQENTDNGLDIAMSVSTIGPAGLTSNPFLLSSLPSSQQFATMVFDGQAFHVVYEDNGSNTLLYQEVGFGAVGIDEGEATRLTISPNPSSDFIKVSRISAVSADLFIIDHLGSTVHSERLSSENAHIDISEFTSGIYSVMIDEEGQITHKKILVVK